MKRNCVNNNCSVKEDCANWLDEKGEPYKGKGDEDCPDQRMVSCGGQCKL